MAGQEHACASENAPRLAEKRHRSVQEREVGAHRVAVAGCSAHLYGETDQPIRQQTAAVHEEIHHVGVVGVLDAAEARLDHGESGLHEHDQEASDQRPDEVNGNFVLSDLIGSIG